MSTALAHQTKKLPYSRSSYLFKCGAPGRITKGWDLV